MEGRLSPHIARPANARGCSGILVGVGQARDVEPRLRQNPEHRLPTPPRTSPYMSGNSAGASWGGGMNGRHPWPSRACVLVGRAVVALVLLTVSFVVGGGTAGADVEKVAGWAGPAYGAGLKHAPTAVRSQSKLWWHDGSWWALMYGTDSEES